MFLLVGMVSGDELFDSLMLGRTKGSIEPGYSYVVKERKPRRAFTHFWNLLEKGYKGLLITRQHPNHVE
ncbi:MAG: hypothetical protein ACE5KV_02645, partial [Thermoplasmata archaeon]